MSRRVIWILTLVTALIAGCATRHVSIQSKKSADATIPHHPRIALLPFDNLSGQEKAGLKITEYFQSQMVGQEQYELLGHGNTFDALKRHRIRSSSTMTSEQIDSLAHDLAVDLILTGSVLEYDEVDNTYLGRIPRVAFNTRLIDCLTKSVVWAAEANGSGDKGELVFGIGAIRSADELAQKMVRETIQHFGKHLED